jgi:hypothetical protein
LILLLLYLLCITVISDTKAKKNRLRSPIVYSREILAQNIAKGPERDNTRLKQKLWFLSSVQHQSSISS